MTQRKYSFEQLDALRTRFVSGESVKVLAAELGVREGRLHALWTYHGLTKKTPMKRRHKVPMQKLKKLHERWCAGESLKTLSNDLGIPRESLAYLMKSAGLKLKRPPGVNHMGGYRGPYTDKQRRAWFALTYSMRANGATWRQVFEAVRAQGYEGTQNSIRKSYCRWEANLKSIFPSDDK
jgi:hypothetical protein